MVSVLIASYNKYEYLVRAVESVRAQETNFDVEIIVVDDGNVDLNTHAWNDQVLCQSLIGANAVDGRQAKEIVHFIRSTIDRMELREQMEDIRKGGQFTKLIARMEAISSAALS